MADNLIASDLSYLVLERQRSESEQPCPVFHQADERQEPAVTDHEERIVGRRLIGLEAKHGR